MLGSKLHSSQKHRLILNPYPNNLPFKDPVENNGSTLLISNSIQKMRSSMGSKQEMKNKLLHEERLANIKANKENLQKEFRLRAVSTVNKLKLKQGFVSKPFMKNINQQIIQVSQSAQPYSVNTLASDLIDLLRCKSVLNQNHLLFYNVKKEHLQTIFTLLLQIRQEEPFPTKQGRTQSEPLDFFRNKMREISMLLYDKNLQSKKNKNGLKSNSTSFQYRSQQYQKEVSKTKNQLEILKKHHLELKTEVEALSQTKQSIVQEFKLKQQQINQQMKTILANRDEITKLQQTASQTRKELSQNQEIITSTKQKAEKILHYVTHQNDQILLLVAEEYRTIEADILEYATYLQCNQLASSLTYEPISITCLTESLEPEIRDINKTLIQNQQMSLVDKSRMMRDFLMKWMEKFKRRDVEQKQVISFKTRCVKNFVDKMDKLLENWTHKQEYLVHLRNEFASNSAKMNDLIKSLQEFTKCPRCSSAITAVYNNIVKVYQKIQQNYKLGNSFY